MPANLLRYGRGVFSFRPGEPLENYILHFDRAAGSGFQERFELDSSAYRLRMSPCYTESPGDSFARLPHPMSPRILSCLRRYSGVVAAPLHCREDVPTVDIRVLRNCVSCHMQNAATEAIHLTVMTKHP